MELLKDTPFETVWFVWFVRPDTPCLTVVIKGTFSVVKSGTCSISYEQELPTGDVFYDDSVENSVIYESDLAFVKPRGECFVMGSCHAPEGKPVLSQLAAFKIGPVTKKMVIIGDRSFEGLFRGQGDPQPFSEMPLCWERSFGGMGSALNPVGTGLGKSMMNGKAVIRLPNIEDPGFLVRSKRDRPPPMGAFPIPRTWPERMKHTGTYDRSWQKNRWPWMPEDFDWSYFNAAPEDQRLDGFFRGDEEIALVNLHPRYSRVRCRLPGLRASAFLRESEGDLLKPLKPELDTITVDADAGKVLCLWRAVTQVPSKSLDEYSHLFVVSEPAGDKRTPADYREWFEECSREQESRDQAFEPAPIPDDEHLGQPDTTSARVPLPIEPKGLSSPPSLASPEFIASQTRSILPEPIPLSSPVMAPMTSAAFGDESAWIDILQEEGSIQENTLELHEQTLELEAPSSAEAEQTVELREELGLHEGGGASRGLESELGMSAEQIEVYRRIEGGADTLEDLPRFQPRPTSGSGAGIPEEPPEKSQSIWIDISMDERGDENADDDVEAAQGLEEAPPTQLLKPYTEAQQAALLRFIESSDVGETRPDEETKIGGVIEQLEAGENEGWTLPRASLMLLADGAKFIDSVGPIQSAPLGLELPATTLFEEPIDTPEDSSDDWTREESTVLFLSRFSGPASSPHDLAESVTRIERPETDIIPKPPARFDAIRAGTADVGVELFDDGLETLKAVPLHIAEERQRQLRERVMAALSSGEGCAGWNLIDADLSELDLSGGDFEDALLTRALLCGSRLDGASFEGSVLHEADLKGASFLETRFDEAYLTDIDGKGVRFERTSFEGVVAIGAKLTKAELTECRCASGDFSRADLSEAVLDRVVLDEADLTGARLDRAVFTDCTLVDAVLSGVSAVMAKIEECNLCLVRAFDGADFTKASLKSSKIHRGRFQEAILRRANLSLAELYSADFSDAEMDDVKALGCALRKAKFQRARLVRAMLGKSDLHFATFEGANLRNADLRGCNLYGAELLEPDTEGVRLEGANLEKTKLAGAGSPTRS